MDNTELLKSVVLSITQRALAGLFAFLIAGGWISEDQSKGITMILAGIIGTLAVYVYTYIQNKAKLKFQDTAIQIAKESSSLTPTELIKSQAKKEIANTQ